MVQGMRQYVRHDRATACPERGRGWAECARLARAIIVAGGLFLLLCGHAPGADADGSFERSSIALRTALHYDPSVEVPLTKLVELYRQSGRVEELLGLYDGHLSQFPADASARLVLARIYMELQDRRAGAFLREAVSRHPDHALLAWQMGRFMQNERDPRAVEEMARAVGLEKSAGRRALWFGELMKSAAQQGREDLVLKETTALLAEGAMTPEQRLRWARQALGNRLARTAVLMMKDIVPGALGTDNRVEALMLLAQLDGAEGKRDLAVRRLDELLEKLAPDYWRRREILMLRLDLAGTGGRDELVEQARKRWQESGGATAAQALTLADVLEAAHRSREALALMQEAVGKLGPHPQLEQRLIELWEREGTDSGALKWLVELCERYPDRRDLALRRVKWLFAGNQAKEAQERFEALVGAVPQEERTAMSMELARWLRRRNQVSEASLILESALASAPLRWDLRRELGELYAVQRRGDALAALFEGEWSHALPGDARLEVAQFLVTRQLWLQAQGLLAPWLADQPGAFDGWLLLAKIEDKLGNSGQSRKALEQARSLCDTDVRYQAWLESYLQQAEAREKVVEAVREEAARLGASGLAPADDVGFSRWLSLVAQATARKAEEEAEGMLTRALAETGHPAERTAEMERLRLDLISGNPAKALDTEQGLRKLLEADEPRREDHRLRLALLYQSAGRPDLAVQHLEKLDPVKVKDARLLRSAVPLCLERSILPLALQCAERLTRLEPSDPAHWVQWTNLLAQSGQEERLRGAVREILSKAHDWKLNEEIREGLQAHLVASQWRSVLSHVGEADTEGWEAARREAAGLERMDLTPAQRRWMSWLVAYLSAGLGDERAKEDAFASLTSLDDRQWLEFPDGLEMSVAGARDSLTTAATVRRLSRDTASAVAVLPPFEMGWGFALARGTCITQVKASQDGRLVFVTDDRHHIHALEVKTGKLKWKVVAPGLGVPQEVVSERGAAPRRVIAAVSGRGVIVRGASQPAVVTPVELVEAHGRLCLLDGERVVCLDAATGVFLWSSQLAEGEMSGMGGAPQSRLATDGARLLVWQPGVSVVSSLNPKSGKLLWQVGIPVPPAPKPGPNNSWGGYDAYLKLKSGMNVENGRVLVYSQTAAMLRVDDGQVLWRLATGELPGFPLAMRNDETLSGGLAMSSGQVLVVRGGTLWTGGTLRMAGHAPLASWAYANGLRAVLQGPGYYTPAMVLQNDKVWMVTGNGVGMVSIMGLPLGRLHHQGTLVGVSDGKVISFNGTAFMTSSPTENGGQSVLVSAETGPESAPGQALPPAGVVQGGRLYSSLGGRLRVHDLRSGVAVFNKALPDDAESWRKTMEEGEVAVAPVQSLMIHRGRRIVGQDPLGTQRRNYLPSGVLYQNDSGGGILCGGATMTVVEGSWMVPVNERALVCLRGTPPSVPSQPKEWNAAPNPPSRATP